MDKKRFVVPVDTEFHRDVKAKAALIGWNISDLVRELLLRWLKGEIEIKKKNNK